MNIYVSNLSFAVQPDDLKKIFTTYGTVSSVNIIMDKFTNRSRGFGFVEMADQQAAEKAMRELDGSMLDGRSIKVSEAREKSQRAAKGSFY